MIRKWLKRIALAAVLVVIVTLLAVTWILRASLPRLEGRVELEGLTAPVEIERDDLGVPTIRGANRLDVARATGFVHAQDRFFQMDLMRRRAAGELSELLGRATYLADKRNRVHRFRSVAERYLTTSDDESRALLVAYAEGVNAGLSALGAAPPEYLLLRTDPAAWLPEDSVLVVHAMYLELQGDRGRRESGRGLMRDLLPPELYEFLDPPGTEWDAPVIGEPYATPPVPPAAIFDLRKQPPAVARSGPGGDESVMPVPGSNGWAVAGTRTADGGALLANDMHLPLRLPNIWYRASLVWTGADGEKHRVTGATLPGVPSIVVGSNGRVAWGFTNSQADHSDLILLETDSDDESLYRTPDGLRPLERLEERIRIKGEVDHLVTVEWTRWGPVIDRDHRGRLRVLRWIAHDPQGVNLDLIHMERARGIDEALEIAARVRLPAQNCMLADHEGRIAWTVIGGLPRRVGLEGRHPISWADGAAGWNGTFAFEEQPRVVDPPSGLVWSANNRVVDGVALERIGDGGFRLGARARQIRDGLAALERATVQDMLAIQLDDRALFLERWRDLLLRTLTPQALADDPRRRELLGLVEETWTGRASIDSVAFRLVRTFRLFLADQVLGSITAACGDADEQFQVRWLTQSEGPLWRLVTERPLHLLDPRFEDWEQQLLAAVDAVLDRFAEDEGALELRTWGERNTVAIRHPISLAVPALARWLDVPAQSLPGAGKMPRVQGPGFGASMRMAVSPGREESGYFHMPGGQSGHPLSPYYRKGHEAWAGGEPTPFLPGPTVHLLTLVP
jgi:penicillin amidase